MTKDQLRQKFLALRSTITLDEWQSRNQQLANRLDTFLQKNPKFVNIFLFVSHRKEPDWTVWAKSTKQTIKLGLPVVVDKKTSSMAFYSWRLGDPLIKGKFGTMEPDTRTQSVMNPTEETLMLIPAVAVDHSGQRLGYGAGFYDRYLAGIKGSVTTMATVHHPFFSADPLPAELHDTPVDWLLSDQVGPVRAVQV